MSDIAVEEQLISLLKTQVEFNMAFFMEELARRAQLHEAVFKILAATAQGFLEGRFGTEQPFQPSALSDELGSLFASFSESQLEDIFKFLTASQKIQLMELMRKARRCASSASAASSSSTDPKNTSL